MPICSRRNCSRKSFVTHMSLLYGPSPLLVTIVNTQLVVLIVRNFNVSSYIKDNDDCQGASLKTSTNQINHSLFGFYQCK